MTLAIVIPYYRITFFEQALRSLANQTDKRFKVYIGDDASKDDPRETIARYASVLDLHYIRFDENWGGRSLVAQWNRCLAQVDQPDWVIVLGDDDVLSPNVVETFHASSEKIKGATVLRFATQLIDAHDTAITEIYRHPERESSVDFIFRKSRSSLSEYVFSYAALQTIGFRELPLAWYSDILAVLEISRFGPVLSLNDASVLVRISGESISGSGRDSSAKNQAAAWFYDYLLTRARHHFNREQRRLLLSRLSKTYRNDKSRFSLFLKLSALHLGMGFWGDYRKLLQTLVKDVVQRNR